jgi:hypothetical protein
MSYRLLVPCIYDNIKSGNSVEFTFFLLLFLQNDNRQRNKVHSPSESSGQMSFPGFLQMMSGQHLQSPIDRHNSQKDPRRRRQSRLQRNTRAMSAKFSQWTPGVATTITITAVGDVIWESIPRGCKAHGTDACCARFRPTHSTLPINMLYRVFHNLILIKST